MNKNKYKVIIITYIKINLNTKILSVLDFNIINPFNYKNIYIKSLLNIKTSIIPLIVLPIKINYEYVKYKIDFYQIINVI